MQAVLLRDLARKCCTTMGQSISLSRVPRKPRVAHQGPGRASKLNAHTWGKLKGLVVKGDRSRVVPAQCVQAKRGGPRNGAVKGERAVTGICAVLQCGAQEK